MASITTRKNKKGLSYLVRIRRKDSPPLTATFPSKTKAVVWARNEESKIDKGDTSTEMDINKRTIRIPVERSKNGRAFTLGITDELPVREISCRERPPRIRAIVPTPKQPIQAVVLQSRLGCCIEACRHHQLQIS